MTENVMHDEYSYLKDETGEFRYCEKCLSCLRKCKQSFRITGLHCARYKQQKKEK